MSNSFVQIPPDDTSPGSKKLDTWLLTVGANSVHREVDRVGGTGDVEIAEVRGSDPTALDHGLVVRQAPPDSIKVDAISSVNLAIGASANLDATTISAASTGKLLQVLVGSSAPCLWEIKTRDGAVEVTQAVLFTGGLAANPTERYTPSSKEGITLAGAGVDENFRVTATNLAGGPGPFDADVFATIEWDEVA